MSLSGADDASDVDDVAVPFDVEHASSPTLKAAAAAAAPSPPTRKPRRLTPLPLLDSVSVALGSCGIDSPRCPRHLVTTTTISEIDSASELMIRESSLRSGSVTVEYLTYPLLT